MRNPLLLFPLAIILLVAIAFISVYSGIMTMTEFIGKMKTLSILLIPLALFAGVIALADTKKGKRDE